MENIMNLFISMYAIIRGNSNYSNSKNNMYVVIMVIYRVFFWNFIRNI